MIISPTLKFLLTATIETCAWILVLFLGIIIVGSICAIVAGACYVGLKILYKKFEKYTR